MFKNNMFYEFASEQARMEFAGKSIANSIIEHKISTQGGVFRVNRRATRGFFIEINGSILNDKNFLMVLFNNESHYFKLVSDFAPSAVPNVNYSYNEIKTAIKTTIDGIDPEIFDIMTQSDFRNVVIEKTLNSLQAQ